jgi:hypothetical protein
MVHFLQLFLAFFAKIFKNLWAEYHQKAPINEPTKKKVLTGFLETRKSDNFSQKV